MQLKYNFSEVSHVGNVREKNEDSCKAVKTINGHLFVVCDGMGGAAEGKKASSLAVDSIVDYFTKEKYDNNQIALYKGLEFANEQIFATSQIFPEFKGMGTTACVILLKEDEFHLAHVGDSRIYLFSDNNLFQLTKDHSFVNQLVTQGTITIEEAKTHKDKNRILKALGVNSKVEPTISSQPMLLKKDDVLLSCSDGLTDMISDEDIKEIISTDSSVELKTKTLVEKALANGGKDNITVQTIEVTESKHTKTIFIDKTLYPKKDLTKTVEDQIETIKTKPFPLKKTLLALLGTLILVTLFWMLFFSNDKQEDDSIVKSNTSTVNKNTSKKEQNKIHIKSTSTKPLFFIIGKENDIENNIYKNVHQYLKLNPKVKNTNIDIEKLNGKKVTSFHENDTVFLTKKQENDR